LNNITVGIKAFIRMAELERALESLVGRGFAEVIVADDSPADENRHMLYQRFQDRLPLRVLKLPFRSGVSYGRNRMVEACSTPYFLLMDDDHFLENDVSPMLDILDSNPQLGAVAAQANIGGKLTSGAGNLYKFGPFIIQDIGFGPQRNAKHSSKGVTYYTYEMIDNFALFRTEVFDDVMWDETFVTFFEHMDFYLMHKDLGKWQFAITPDYVFGHTGIDSGEITERYKSFRLDADTRKSLSNYFNKKWGLKRGVVWGFCLKPKRRSPTVMLVHTLVGIGQMLRLVHQA